MRQTYLNSQGNTVTPTQEQDRFARCLVTLYIRHGQLHWQSTLDNLFLTLRQWFLFEAEYFITNKTFPMNERILTNTQELLEERQRYP